MSHWWLQCIESPCDIDKATIECHIELCRVNQRSISLTEITTKKRLADLPYLPTILCIDYIRSFAKVNHSQLESGQRRQRQRKSRPTCEAILLSKQLYAWGIVIVATFSFVSGFSAIRLSSAMCLYATYICYIHACTYTNYRSCVLLLICSCRASITSENQCAVTKLGLWLVWQGV